MPPLTDIAPLYPYPQAAPNEPVTLHEGPVAIPGGMAGTGRLVFRWLPSAGLRLEADLDSMQTPRPRDRLNVAVADSTAEVLFSSISTGKGASGPFARASGSVSSFETGTGAGLRELGFQVVNFNDFLTPGPKPVAITGSYGLKVIATLRITGTATPFTRVGAYSHCSTASSAA